MGDMLACCGVQEHPWDRHNVQTDWLPASIRCLIVGENPGAARSEYFYNPPTSYARDRVVVRKGLLHGLHAVGLLNAATLEGFRDAGFLFDHGIRCPLPRDIVKREHRLAKRYVSTRVGGAIHLLPLLSRAETVWVMGHIASNAVANATPQFPKGDRMISKTPYPGEIVPGSRFFVSEYFTRWNRRTVPEICAAFARFARARLTAYPPNSRLERSGSTPAAQPGRSAASKKGGARHLVGGEGVNGLVEFARDRFVPQHDSPVDRCDHGRCSIGIRTTGDRSSATGGRS